MIAITTTIVPTVLILRKPVLFAITDSQAEALRFHPGGRSPVPATRGGRPQ